MHFCGWDGHVEYKCCKKMETLEETMKNHNINLDSSSNSSTHGHVLFSSRFSFNNHVLLTNDSYIIEHIIMWLRIRHFSSLNECNTKWIFLNVVGSRIVHLENGYFKDVLCFPIISCNLLPIYWITYFDEGKTTNFSPH